MIYEEYYTLAEITRWQMETDIEWDKIDKEIALSQPEVLDQLRDACLIESYHPISTKRLLDLMWDDIDATGILSVELFEGFRHFLVLKRYLEEVGYDKPITDLELKKMRQKAVKGLPKPELTQELINFIFSEHFAAFYFVRISQKAKEPVLKQIATFIARDEFRHTRISHDLMKQRLEQKKEAVEEVLEAAYNFRHYGNEALEEVPVFQRNDVLAINSFMKKVELLTGRRLVDYIKEKKLK